MMFVTVIEYVLKAVAIIDIAFGAISSGLVLLSPPGLMALFVTVLVVVTVLGCGTALLAIDSLYPQAVVVPGLPGLLWLVAPASVASVVLSDLLLEGTVLRVLRRWGMGMLRVRLVEVVLGGFVAALSLATTARLLSEAELASVAALAVGLIGAFVRYYLGTWMDSTTFGDLAGREADFFDEEVD